MADLCRRGGRGITGGLADAATANGAFALGGQVTLTLLLMLLVPGAVLAWFGWFLLRHCTAVQRQQMLALMATIFMALAFFTLY